MKIETLKKRLTKNRPMTTITMRLRWKCGWRFEASCAFTGVFRLSPLARAYIGQGLRADLERLENDTVSALVESLKRHGVSDEVLQEALSEVIHN